jgi:hypothetical protein
MTTAIIITLCILLLAAYVFDITAPKTRIPSVILLLLLGLGVRQISDYLSIPVPDLTPALPILGTIGLILIVLEGSLDLEFNTSKTPIIKKSIFVGLLPMIILALCLAYAFSIMGYTDYRVNLINAIPLCVISSAIAIPSVRSLSVESREFITYESTISDILGVLLFNFIALNQVFDLHSMGHFLLQIVIIILVSFIATLGLAFLLSKIEHHIKFIPITLLVILIYAISKIYHLPGLLFIMSFGLFLGNLDELRHFKLIDRLKPDELNAEVMKFKELITEGAFLIRALFFLLFGFLIETSALGNTDTLLWALGISLGIYVIRGLQLKLSGVSLFPVVFIAPRGLITILLFLSIDPLDQIDLVNDSLLIQLIGITALVMMAGLMFTKKKPETESA